MISENKLFINMKMKQILTLLLAYISVGVLAKENIPNPNINNVTYNRVAAGCSPSSSQTDMDVNNVRATILGGGDMWWNLDEAQYEIPKGGGINSLFAGSLWIGGVDAGGQLKVAAMTYRQGGNDFWPGPLDVATATITEEECNAWDKHFKIDRLDVEEYVARKGIDPFNISLEEALENFAGCAVIISHDRWFLDRVCTHILAFEGDSEVYSFEGSFSEYEENKLKRLGRTEPTRFKYKKLLKDS